jgi:Ca2+-transporting ATPase
MNWHQLSKDKVMKETGTGPEGLSNDEVSSRIKKHGHNVLPEKKKEPAWLLFLKQFKDFMILVLIAAAVVSGVIGDITDSIIILVIVFLNAIVGFVQEALKKMAAPQARVLRNCKTISITSEEILHGDIVFLEAGNIVKADLR